MSLPYDSQSKDSILDYALLLVNNSLTDFLEDSDFESNTLNKGGFGQILEKYYFHKELDSLSQPDFPEAGLELKSSPIKKLKVKGELRAKERLVLNIINYQELIHQEFMSSSFYSKNSRLLLVFYLYDRKLKVLDYKISLVGIWDFPEEDIKVIEHDWKLIQRKVLDGEAHMLSEGDTFYLGACTKGASAKSVRVQPNSNIPAKQRAFSLKTGYVNHILAKLSGIEDGSFGKVVKAPELKEDSLNIEEAILKKIRPYYGKTPEDIANILNFNYNSHAKQRFAQLSTALLKSILGISMDKKIEELSKANISLKSIRLNSNNLPKENISFSAFEYLKIVDEGEWELSNFNQQLEKRFLFIFYKEDSNKQLVLEKALFWNMPYIDRQEAKVVWENTIGLIKEGRIVKEVTPKNIFKTYFPKQTENRVAHVRPHAKDKNDTYPLPVQDQLTNKGSYMKHSFWLNNTYIRDGVYYISQQSDER